MADPWHLFAHAKATHEARHFSLDQQYRRLARATNGVAVAAFLAVVVLALIEYPFVAEALSLSLASVLIGGESRRAHRRRIAELKRYVATLRALARMAGVRG